MTPQRGFTLIELLVTLALLALLSTVVVPLAQVQVQRQKEQQLRAALVSAREAIDAYKKASDEGKIPKDAGATGYPRNLQVLVDGVEDRSSPERRKRYFLRRIPRDPFHDNPDTADARTWQLRAYASDASAPKPGDDVYDIMSRSPLVGLNGVPYSKW